MQCIYNKKKLILKGTCIRTILISGAFLLFLPCSASRFTFNSNCQLAYKAILSLQFPEAQRLIDQEKAIDGSNLIPLYLENYIDFLTLFISEDRTLFEKLKERKSLRIETFENGPKNSPYYRYCIAGINLQWALTRLKFGEYTTAAFEIRKAHSLLTANKKTHPKGCVFTLFKTII